MTISIRETIPEDVEELILSIRQKDKEEALGQGLDPIEATHYANQGAVYRRTGLVDGRVAAIWGVHGTLLGSKGIPYLITNNLVEDIPPIRFAKIYKKELEEMRRLFPVLENYVDSDYKEAVKMLILAGFRFPENITLPNGKMYHRFRIDNDV